MKSQARIHFGVLAGALLLTSAGCAEILGLEDRPIDDGSGTTVVVQICEPGTTAKCAYSGPADTMDVGACREGIRQCLSDGSGYGECAGEVTPKAEDCTTPLDENCDGQANEAESGCICTPNAISACYTGPAETVGVGVCKMGMGTCNPEGTGIGSCTGEVKPGTETCADPGDEDCDAYDCVKRATLYGDTDAQGATAVAVDPSDDSVYVVGAFAGSMTVDGTTLIEIAQGEGFLLKLSSAGELLWAKQIGDIGSDSLTAVAVHKDGTVAIAGRNSGTIDLTDPPLAPGPFVATLSPAGTILWARKIGTGSTEVASVAFTPDGDVLCGGHFLGALDFGDGPLEANVGLVGQGTDGFVARLRGSDGSGKLEDGGWAMRFGDELSQAVKAVASDAVGNVLLGMDFEGTVLVNGLTKTSAGLRDVLLVKLSSTGNTIWQRQVGDGENQVLTGMALDAQGGPLAVGQFQGTIDVGGAAHTSPDGVDEFFVIKYGPGNVLEWSNAFGGSGHVSVAFDKANNALLSGTYVGDFDLGGTVLAAQGTDIFVAKLDSAGEHVWSKRFGDQEFQEAAGVAALSAGASVVVGRVSGTTDFGTGPLEAKGFDVFVTVFAE